MKPLMNFLEWLNHREAELIKQYQALHDQEPRGDCRPILDELYEIDHAINMREFYGMMHGHKSHDEALCDVDFCNYMEVQLAKHESHLPFMEYKAVNNIKNALNIYETLCSYALDDLNQITVINDL